MNIDNTHLQGVNQTAAWQLGKAPAQSKLDDLVKPPAEQAVATQVVNDNSVGKKIDLLA
jgi:hypothetical protein